MRHKDWPNFETWREEYDRLYRIEHDVDDEFSSDEDLRDRWEAGDSPFDAVMAASDQN